MCNMVNTRSLRSSTVCWPSRGLPLAHRSLCNASPAKADGLYAGLQLRCPSCTTARQSQNSDHERGGRPAPSTRMNPVNNQKSSKKAEVVRGVRPRAPSPPTKMAMTAYSPNSTTSAAMRYLPLIFSLSGCALVISLKTCNKQGFWVQQPGLGSIGSASGINVLSAYSRHRAAKWACTQGIDACCPYQHAL